MTRPRVRPRFAALVLLIGAACGGTARLSADALPHPLIHLGTLDTIGAVADYGFSVVRCDGVPFWIVGTGGSAAAFPDTLRYGTTPAGYASTVGPLPLQPGCYRIFVSGGSRATFRIDRSGHLTTSDTNAVR